MALPKHFKHCAVLLGLIVLLVAPATGAAGAEVPPYEFDAALSLTGNCATNEFDPVPDPGCAGEPPAYPAPPNGPAQRFNAPRAIAVDPSGNEYVASWANGSAANGRVQIFDDEGKFITELPVPGTKSIAVDSKGNLYVYDDAGAVLRYPPSQYKPDTGEIAYGNPAVLLVATASFVGAVAVDTSPARLDQVLVTQPKEITRYSSAEAGNSVLDGGSKPIPSIWPNGLAVDGQRGRIYVSFCKKESSNCAVKVLTATAPYTELKEVSGSETPAGAFASASGRLSIAVDEGSGDFFVADVGNSKVYRFNEDYEYLSQLEVDDFESNTSIQMAVSNGTQASSAGCGYPKPEGAADACNRHYLFVPVLKSKGSGGRALAYHPPGQTPPITKGVSTGGIGETEAELQAQIFPGGLKTTYHFELLTQAQYEANGNQWSDAVSVGGGTIAANKLSTEVSAFATGLTPSETYRFRAVAGNELGAAEEEGQNEALFATYEDAPISTPCPNEALRLGSSVLLPDCRAYELVSPADTNGRPPKGVGFVGGLFPTVQSSPAGDAVSFKIEGGSIPGSSGVGSFEGDPYVSRRTASGWSTELAGPNGAEAAASIPASSAPDQVYSFWTARIEGPLALDPERSTEYLYYPDGHSELIGRGSEGTEPFAEGKLITENATHVVFQSANLAPTFAQKLEPDAPPTGTEAVYDRTIDSAGNEQTHTVSLLPGDLTPVAGEDATYRGASKDGEGIAFAIGANSLEFGTLYLRVGNETTYEIGDEVEFAGVSEGGQRIFYLEGGNLKAFDAASEEVIDFSTTGDATPVNVSADGTRAAFVSPSVLGAANPQGDVAQAGKQNLYLSTEGEVAFIATVTDRDVQGEPPPLQTQPTDGLGLWTDVVGGPVAEDPSRLNPDGSVFLFQSRAEITGYGESEFPQIYRYDSNAGELQCLSCIPTKRPATGGASLESYGFDAFSGRPFSSFGYIANQTPDGKRVFFDSTEALVSTDTDGVTDVYEWIAQGTGSCTRPAGCVHLISSGQSDRDNFLYAHSTDGEDVFFFTGDQLTGSDDGEGAPSIYDAKVGGGFPEPGRDEVCIGDGCRPGVSPTPALPSPATSGPAANDQTSTGRKACPKAKRKVKHNGKARCVNRKQRKHKSKGAKAKQRAGANRGAGK